MSVGRRAEGDRGFATDAVHAGTEGQQGSINTPVYLSTTYELDDERYAQWAAGDSEALLYSRVSTPNGRAVARKVAALERAELGLAFGSGMAAISTTLLALLSAGDHVVANADIYGGTYSLLTEELSRYDVSTTLADARDPASYAAAITERTRLLYVETLSNPMLKVADLDAFGRLAAAHDLWLVVDNTFATPWACRPLEHGAHLVLHSTTKFLNGHSDALGGVVVGPAELIGRIHWPMVHFGGAMSPHAAYLLERGMRTLVVRMERQTASAAAIANALDGHPALERIIHPSRADHPDHALAGRLLPHGTAMLGLVLRGGDAACLPFMRALAVFTEATSVGGVESLIEAPFNISHLFIPEQLRHGIGLVPGFIRCAVGIEDIDDLVADLRRGLDHIASIGIAA